MRSPFQALLVLASAIAFTFLLLPLLAIFLRVAPVDLIGVLDNEEVREALLVSLKTSAIAHVIILLVGTPVAYLLGTRNFRGRGLLITLVELPLVLPPAVAGIGLLAAFGRRGLLGDSLAVLGISIPFTQVAVVLAIVFVASPFYIRQAIAAFASVDRTLLDASRTLGSGPARTFWRVVNATRGRRPGGRLLARVRSRPRGIRRDHHLRRQLRGRERGLRPSPSTPSSTAASSRRWHSAPC